MWGRYCQTNHLFKWCLEIGLPTKLEKYFQIFFDHQWFRQLFANKIMLSKWPLKYRESIRHSKSWYSYIKLRFQFRKAQKNSVSCYHCVCPFLMIYNHIQPIAVVTPLIFLSNPHKRHPTAHTFGQDIVSSKGGLCSATVAALQHVVHLYLDIPDCVLKTPNCLPPPQTNISYNVAQILLSSVPRKTTHNWMHYEGAPVVYTQRRYYIWPGLGPWNKKSV